MSMPLLPALTFDDCVTRSDVEQRIESWWGSSSAMTSSTAWQLLAAASLRGDVDAERLEEFKAVNEGFESDARAALLELCTMLPPSTRPQ